MAKKKLPKQVGAQINKYIQVLKDDNLPIQHIVVYGSYAKGTPHQWSDIDLCVVSSRFKDTWSAIEYLWSRRTFDKKYTIEPIGFSVQDFRDGSPLIDEIKRTGIELVKK